MDVQLIDQVIALPYGALITRIAEYAEVSTRGLKELLLGKGPINLRFLNASNAHLQEAEQEQRPQRPPRAARVDGASSSTSQDKRLGRMEITLQELQ
jgi:hypothetical protein